jgi:pimeloyl-ACP methyl ester carboxylesterase
VSARVAHQLADVDGVRLHLLHYGGSGRLVLLLHGVGGSAWLWHDVAPALTDLGSVVALDLRGYGPSQWPGGERCTTQDHVADIRALIGALGGEDYDIVGFSWAGWSGWPWPRPASRCGGWR